MTGKTAGSVATGFYAGAAVPALCDLSRDVPAMEAARVTIRTETAGDEAQRETLLDAAFGPNRHGRTCQRLREGRAPADGLALVAACDGRVVGTLRLWPVTAGGRPALLLGPLAVDATMRDLGLGAALMREAITTATARGHGAIVLLGDAPYYARFGFAADTAKGLVLPGPFERDRLLGLELVSGALAGAEGLIRAAGARKQRVPHRPSSARRTTPRRLA